MRQIVADATGKPGARRRAPLEASCLGAGMLAAAGAGWYADARPRRRAAMQGEVVAAGRARPGARRPLPRAARRSTATSTRRCATPSRGSPPSAPDRTDEPLVPRPADHRRRRRRPLPGARAGRPARAPTSAGSRSRTASTAPSAELVAGARPRRRGSPWSPTRTPGRCWARASRRRCRATPRRSSSTTPRPTRRRPTSCRSAAGHADALVAVGSGTLNDLCKYVTHRTGRRCAVFATAPSMDGYVTTTVSITRDGLQAQPAGPRARRASSSTSACSPRRRRG